MLHLTAAVILAALAPAVSADVRPKTTAELCPTVNAACSFLSDGCGGVASELAGDRSVDLVSLSRRPPRLERAVDPSKRRSQ